MKRPDPVKVLALLIIGIPCAVFILGSLWLTFFAPCDWLGWLPAAETPARCFR